MHGAAQAGAAAPAAVAFRPLLFLVVQRHAVVCRRVRNRILPARHFRHPGRRRRLATGTTGDCGGAVFLPAVQVIIPGPARSRFRRGPSPGGQYIIRHALVRQRARRHSVDFGGNPIAMLIA